MTKARNVVGVTHIHAGKFIKQAKGEKAFIGDEIEGRLNL